MPGSRAGLTVAVFAISAGLAGLAGAVEILGVHGNVRADWNPAYGLAVVPLVFLARFNGFASIGFVFLLLGAVDRRRERGAAARRAESFHAGAGGDRADHAGAGRICRPPLQPVAEGLSDGRAVHRSLPDLAGVRRGHRGVPLLLAGLGEQISEKAGVLNIGIEGMMLVGAYRGFVVASIPARSGSASSRRGRRRRGGAVMALLCVRLGLNQIVIGIALTLGVEGLTALLHHFQFSRSYPRLPRRMPPSFRCCPKSRSSGRPCSSTT